MDERQIREAFVENEIGKGKILVLWKDIDNDVIGWEVNADNERLALACCCRFIKIEKEKKTESIIK